MKRNLLKLTVAGLLVVILLAMPIAGACAKPAPASAPAPAGKSAAKPDVDRTGWPKMFVLSCASAESTVSIIGAGMCQLITRYTGVKATNEPGMGSPNIHKLAAGEIQAAYCGTEQIIDGLNGSGSLADIGIPPMRFLASGHMSIHHLIALKNSGIKTPADFRGKRLMTTKTGSVTMKDYTESVLEAYGMTAKDAKLQQYSTTAEANDSLKEGTTDVIMHSGGLPISYVSELAEARELYFVSIGEAEVKSLIAKHPIHGPAGVMPAGTYKGQGNNATCGTMMARYVVQKDLPESFVYEVMTAIYGHLGELQAIHPVAKEYSLERAVVDILFPYHPGAIKYYKEKGVWTAQFEAEQQRLLAQISKK